MLDPSVQKSSSLSAKRRQAVQLREYQVPRLKRRCRPDSAGWVQRGKTPAFHALGRFLFPRGR